jgi:NAD-dependent deacetylase
MSEPWRTQCGRAAALLRAARRAVAFTGAGISVPSGIPDFRSPGGLWSRFDPMAVASVQALAANPVGVWEFLLDAVRLFHRAEPNPAHRALAALEADGLLAGVVTQNIDGLHQRAGSRRVVEFHGSAGAWRCHRCGLPHDHASYHELTRADLPVTCPCGGLVRPEVVFFGEAIPERAVDGAQELLDGADLVLIVGTSGDVAPASAIPWRVKRAGGTILEVNLGPTAYAELSDLRLDAPAERVLPLLYELAKC